MDINTTVLIEVRHEYGQERYHPVNSTAQSLASIADTVTLTPRTIQIAEKMGYKIQFAQKKWGGS